MTVLLAADAETTTELMRRVLADHAHEVVVAGDEEEVWSRLRVPGAPRLVVLDQGMPGADWLELCRRIRRQEGQVSALTYVILLNASVEQQEAAARLRSGPDDCLVAPLDSAALRLSLRSATRVVRAEAELLEAREAMRRHVTHDDLTGVVNRAAILDTMALELIRSQRERRPLGVLMVDVDHFKEVNDTRGHQAGDAVLRTVAERMTNAVRAYDHVGRYGGDEFLVLLPGCDTEAGGELAERLREAVARETIRTPRVEAPVTVSIGVACQEVGAPTDIQGLIRAADEALYEAKSRGRNQVVRARPGNATETPDAIEKRVA